MSENGASPYHIDIICCINDIPRAFDWDGQSKAKMFGDQHLDFVTQFLILYSSIKANWHFPYTIYLCHSLPLTDATRFRLESLDIVIREISSPDPKKFPFLIRSKSWEMKTYGTHKLYLDTDMIALKNPEFDLTKDFLIMPCNSNLMVDKRGEEIAKASKQILKHPVKKWNFGTNILSRMWDKKLTLDDYRRKRFMPHVNGGAILMKNSISARFAKEWWKTFISLKKNMPPDHRPLLYSDGLTITKMTSNWGVFDLGFNYFDTKNPKDPWSLPSKYYVKNRISLYHYVSDHSLDIRFPTVFTKMLKIKKPKLQKPHVNIVIDTNFDDDATFNVENRKLTKEYSRLEQTIILVRSIQRNWKFDYTINVLVCSKMTPIQKKVLKSLGVETYQVEPTLQVGDVKLARNLSYTLKLRNPGTHRFILDSDMVAVNDIGPQLDKLYRHDIAAMYEWDTNVCKDQVGYDNCVYYLHRKFKLSPPRIPFKVEKLSHSYDRHFGNKKLPCPLYNPITLVREATSQKFGPIYERLWRELYIAEDHINSAYMLQLGMSVAMQHVAPSIAELPAGTNMLPALMIHPKFKDFQRTYLLHCCTGSYILLEKLCDFYLDNDPNKKFKGYDYYYKLMLTHSEKMVKDIQAIDQFYDSLNIEPDARRPLSVTK